MSSVGCTYVCSVIAYPGCVSGFGVKVEIINVDNEGQRIIISAVHLDKLINTLVDAKKTVEGLEDAIHKVFSTGH